MGSSEGTAELNPSAPEAETNLNGETPKPRKAIPVNKPNTAKPQGPALRPKNVPKPLPVQSETQSKKPSSLPCDAHNKLKPANKPLPPKAAPFGDRYERITTYLEKPLFNRIHNLYELGEIARITGLLNAAIKEYLDKYYPLL